MSFNKLEFIEKLSRIVITPGGQIKLEEEYYTITNGVLNTKLIYDLRIQLWKYANPRTQIESLTNKKVSKLRSNLIIDIKHQRTAQINKVNLVRDLLHPDIIPLVVNLLNDSISIHYLETVENAKI